jgi:hypothetical protein
MWRAKMIARSNKIFRSMYMENSDVEEHLRILALTDMSELFTLPSWTILAFGLKLWLHISIRGSSIGISPCKRNAREDAADIAHPREDEYTSCP